MASSAELLLLSGGIDSIAIAYMRRPAAALTIDYGQAARHAEIAASRVVCESLGLRHQVLRVPLKSLGLGTMARSGPSQLSQHAEWWPFRNQMLATLAGMMAIREGLRSLVIGTVSTDRRHRDGQAWFVRAVDSLLSRQEGALRLVAPAIRLTTSELLRRSKVPRSLLGWAHSCHRASLACGQCAGCAKHEASWQAYDELAARRRSRERRPHSRASATK